MTIFRLELRINAKLSFTKAIFAQQNKQKSNY